MARICSMVGVSILLVVSGVVQGAVLSPDANFIKTREYLQFSTGNSIGPLAPDPNEPDVWKANGTLPSIGHGLAVWEDGRSGRQSVMGYVLTDPGEFLISDATDAWQEGNPFAGWNAAGGYVWSVYDADKVGPPVGDFGDIQGSNTLPDPTWLVQETRRQRSPVFSNVPSPALTILSWIDHPETAPVLGGKDNIDIWTIPVPPSPTFPLTVGAVHITAGKPAPRDALAGDGRYLTWQEFREDANTLLTSWDIVVYDLGGTYPDANDRFRCIDKFPDVLKHQTVPDISGDLLVFTQTEDPAGLSPPTNIYFLDLSDPNSVPVAITTTGTATNAAISYKDGNYFVVWQDYRLDGGMYDFTGFETDHNWDIWGQEISIDSNGDWALHDGGPFLIRGDDGNVVGRQYFPDIDGLDVVWQVQDAGAGEVYVWGPVPEPCTAIVVGITASFLLAARRKRGRQKT